MVYCSQEVRIMTISASKLARHILGLAKKDADARGETSDITPMKLQKLLYYCQGYHLALTGRPLFDDIIEAWDYGPVVRRVHKEYSQCSKQSIPFDNAELCDELDPSSANIIELAWDDKSAWSAKKLSDMTHNEPAWREAYARSRNTPLSLDTMRGYFYSTICEERDDDDEDTLWDRIGESVPESELHELIAAF